MKNILTILIASLLLATAGCITPGGIGGGGGSGGGASVEDVGTSGSELVQQFLKVKILLAKVQTIQLKAQGLKEEAATLEKAIKDAEATPGKDELKVLVDTSADQEESLKTWRDSTTEVSDEAKDELAKSLPPLLIATGEMKSLVEKGKEWFDGAKVHMKGLNALKMKKEWAAPIYVATNTPKEAKNYLVSVKNLFAFANKVGVKDLPDPSAALADGPQ